jgi:hypothetical protein
VYERLAGGEHNTALNSLIAEFQPQAIATDGDQPSNYARLVGQVGNAAIIGNR